MMSRLGQAVAADLRIESTTADEVDSVLAAHGVTSSSSPSAAASILFTRLKFSGTKQLTGVDHLGIQRDQNHHEEVPFDFDWELGPGLYGVGSDENLRGKSSTLRILTWALRGRCDLKNEVRSWIDKVDVDMSIGSNSYQVTFEVDHARSHAPVGTLSRSSSKGASVIGNFNSDAEFEEVMGSTMMTELRLPPITAAHEGRRTQHAWPTYAGALLIRGDTLDNLLGEHSFAGLPSRLLSMFVGAEWAASRNDSTTAVTIAEIELAGLERSATEQVDALAMAYQKAKTAVDEAVARLEKLDVPPYDPAALNAILREYDGIDVRASRAVDQLSTGRNALAMITSQYQAEKARRVQRLEDRHASLFFQGLQPHVCPRCATPVSDERRDSERTANTCSVCVSTLPVEPAAAADDGKAPASSMEVGLSLEDIDEDPVDDLEALEQAMNGARIRVAELKADLEWLTNQREELKNRIEADQEAQKAAAARWVAELDLARAQGAADALAPEGMPEGPDQGRIASLRRDLPILRSAKKAATAWVQDGQRQWLTNLSTDITELAREFGMDNLTGVELGGGATMRVNQGGSTNSYSRCERGEKLRLKLATAISLSKQGRTTGIGRHPGLLFVDSPGAEEVHEDDLDSMLEALRREAEESNIQVFVGTRHTEVLINLLGENRCRLGKGTGFVW